MWGKDCYQWRTWGTTQSFNVSICKKASLVKGNPLKRLIFNSLLPSSFIPISTMITLIPYVEVNQGWCRFKWCVNLRYQRVRKKYVRKLSISTAFVTHLFFASHTALKQDITFLKAASTYYSWIIWRTKGGRNTWLISQLTFILLPHISYSPFMVTF